MRNIPFAVPSIDSSDIEAVKLVLETQTRLTDGVQCLGFEQEFGNYISPTSEVYCLTTSSCMAALHLAYMALGIGPGDEVICTAMSHVATAHSVSLVGATPVFVDCGFNGNLSGHDIEKYITPRTKAIALVHFLGNPCNMTKIMEVADNYGLKVIEDCALALGSWWEGRHVGLWGDVGCFSFYPAKHITTGEGGMLVAKDNSYGVYGRARWASRFGYSVQKFESGYDVNRLGLNYRMDELSAALGRSQLKKLDGIISARRENFNRYESKLNTIMNIGNVLYYRDYMICLSSYAYSMRTPNKEIRDQLIRRLKDKGIECSVYYPHPIPRLEYYREKYGYKKAWFKNAISIADTTVALPIGPHVTEEDIDYICEVLNG